MICHSCRNEFVSGTCLTCGVHSLMEGERELCRERGRREMLRLVAIGAACAEAIYCDLDQGDINGCHDWYDRELAARRIASIAEEMLR